MNANVRRRSELETAGEQCHAQREHHVVVGAAYSAIAAFLTRPHLDPAILVILNVAVYCYLCTRNSTDTRRQLFDYVGGAQNTV